ncbi:hypothetical protein F511_01798, partial [Dorcoceras hygrometricum]
RKEKGLCYRCGEPYKPSHRCNNKSLRVAFLVDDGDEQPVELLEHEFCVQVGNTDAISHECNILELSLFSTGGITQPQTMKLRGKVMGKDMVVMIDSGASHNFVSRKLVERLGLKVDEMLEFGVYLGDGGRVSCQGVCRKLQVDLQQCILQIDGHVVEPGRVDLILGVVWLRTLGEVVVN